MIKCFLTSNFHLIITCSFLFSNICESQEFSEESLFGNWQIKPHPIHKIIYKEIYFDNGFIYYYEENLGYMPKSKFFLDGDVLFHSQLGSEFQELGKIKLINENCFMISKENTSLFYQRVTGKNLLEDLINQEITQNEFSLSFFRRKQAMMK
ncbi:hypothetical protein ACOKFD_13400 [Flagellimonas sp. S174]|uniref:hypothetical protein n=1 Tax=Flagellimonas sp. S174 TaxID=3410790 RepID=UPI003BF596F6